MTVANTLAYQFTELITAVNCLIVQALVPYIIKLFTAVIISMPLIHFNQMAGLLALPANIGLRSD